MVPSTAWGGQNCFHAFFQQKAEDHGRKSRRIQQIGLRPLSQKLSGDPNPQYFLSLVFGISLINFRQGVSLVVLAFSLGCQGFSGFGSERNPW